MYGSVRVRGVGVGVGLGLGLGLWLTASWYYASRALLSAFTLWMAGSKRITMHTQLSAATWLQLCRTMRAEAGANPVAHGAAAWLAWKYKAPKTPKRHGLGGDLGDAEVSTGSAKKRKVAVKLGAVDVWVRKVGGPQVAAQLWSTLVQKPVTTDGGKRDRSSEARSIVLAHAARRVEEHQRQKMAKLLTGKACVNNQTGSQSADLHPKTAFCAAEVAQGTPQQVVPVECIAETVVLHLGSELGKRAQPAHEEGPRLTFCNDGYGEVDNGVLPWPKRNKIRQHSDVDAVALGVHQKKEDEEGGQQGRHSDVDSESLDIHQAASLVDKCSIVPVLTTEEAKLNGASLRSMEAGPCIPLDTEISAEYRPTVVMTGRLFNICVGRNTVWIRKTDALHHPDDK